MESATAPLALVADGVEKRERKGHTFNGLIIVGSVEQLRVALAAVANVDTKPIVARGGACSQTKALATLGRRQ